MDTRGVVGMELPKSLVDYLLHSRVRALKKLVEEGFTPEVLLEYTRATPVVVTCGPEGPRGAVRMVAPLPRPEYLEELTLILEEYAYRKRPKSLHEVVKVLLDHVYLEEKLDLTRLGALEMARRHTWRNLVATRRASLVFFTPPSTSYELVCDVEIHEKGLVKRYVNALHDLFHGGHSDYPAIVFWVREVYDKSNTSTGFGRRIYP